MADERLVVVAIFRPTQGCRRQVMDALKRAIPRVHEEEGCNLYAIQEAADGVIWMIEHWESVAHLDAHGAGPVVAELNAELEGLLLNPVEVVRLGPVPVGHRRKGVVFA